MAQDAQVTRRQVVAGAAATGAWLAMRSAPAGADAGAGTAQGVVFDDDPAGAPPGSARRGVASVMVSNGREVVLTDGDGRWRLPVASGDSVFVIKPTGWMTPVAPDTGLPLWAYVHTPTGSPDSLGLRFRGLDASGALPESIDFPSRRQDESVRFDALLFTDPQPESLTEIGFVRDDVVAHVAGTNAAFGITHGDLMFDDLSFYDRYNRIVGSIGLPWYNVPGNHDINFEAPDDRHSRETFKRVFGARYGAFQYGGATFFLLDNVEYLGAAPGKSNNAGKYRGFFSDDQLGFVRNVLAHVPTASLVVFSFHIPLRTAVGTEANFAAENTAAFLAAISTHPNSISFAGHTHTNEHHYLGADAGFSAGSHHHHVLAAVSGSWWSGPFDERGIPVALQGDGCPNGFHILSVDGGRASTRFVSAHDPNRNHIRLTLDSQVHRNGLEVLREYRPGALLAGPIAAEAVVSTRLLANLFDGGPNSTLTAAFGAGAPLAMRRVARTDPFVEEVYARNPDSKKPWVQPVISTHLWEARLPAELGRGTHRVTVRGHDEFDRPVAATMILEVTG